MSRLSPTINSTLYSGIVGDRRQKVVKATVAGTYTSAAVADGGILLTPADVGMQSFDYVQVFPTFTADTIEEQLVGLGPSTSTTAGWVLALTDKADDLETANATAVTGVAHHILVVGN